MDNNEMIKNKLMEIEKAEGIKILFAVESGSRAWRLESANSDYDVRFVFLRPMNDYLSVFRKKDVMIKCYDKNGNPHEQKGCEVDIEGFDIYKFARLLLNSNPSVIEWLKSDIVYYGSQPEELIEFAENQFKPVSLFYHYASMCRQNYLKYIKSGENTSYKKYLYAMRGLINAKFIIEKNTLPHINFNKTLNEVNIPSEIKMKLWDVIKIKKQGLEIDGSSYISEFDIYIEEFLKNVDSLAPKEIPRSTGKEIDEFVKFLVYIYSKLYIYSDDIFMKGMKVNYV